MFHKKPYGHDQQEDSMGTPENVADDSNFSGDEGEAYEVYTPSPKKRRGTQKKKVVTVPVGEGDGSRSRGEVYPPPDSWSWRKYGQKPIKGSPYPRGYYRCSSSKGCPARKQVERSCLDRTVLLITYSCEHNHAPPATTSKHHYHHPTTTTTATATNATPPAAAASTSTSSTTTDNIPVKLSPGEEFGVFANQPDLDSDNSSSFNELAGELGWFSDVGSITMLDCPALVGPAWFDADVAVMLTIGEEDQSLFGDLGELPECSVLFRRRGVEEITCCAGTG